jgi:excisionase family DNA binding protein
MASIGDPRRARRWLSCGQVAKRIGVSRETVKRWCQRGHLRYERRANGYYLISVSEYEKLVARMVSVIRDASIACQQTGH